MRGLLVLGETTDSERAEWKWLSIFFPVPKGN
jgi:hypothetical protein